MLLSVGADKEDVKRLIMMLRAVGKFGRRLDEIADECANDLEALTVAEAEDTAASQRADDDGWTPNT
jgi:hypothetical protein